MKKLKIILFVFAVFTSANTFACSCPDIHVEHVAYMERFGLSKIKVNDVSLLAKASSYFKKKEYTRTYSVTVLEDIKGKFISNSIKINGFIGDGSCGKEVSFGEELFVITYKDDIKTSLTDVAVCNTRNEVFAEEVKAELKSPSSLYNSVETLNWTLINKASNHSLYADTNNVTKDEYGSYIWLLRNGGLANFKSHKSKIQIACKEKMFSVSHEIGFSDYNAKGDVVETHNYQAHKRYEWLRLTPEYSKLLKHVC
jgi:hypothetical protein